MEPSDLELVRAAAQGDRAAFHALVDRHAGGLFKTALSLSRNRADAEDVLQETLAGAFQSLGGFNGQASVRTWLTRILVRQAARAWHRSRNQRRTVSLEPDESASAGRGLSVAGATPAVDQRIDVLSMLETIPQEFREVFLLRETEGLSYAEIAQALGIPRGTVESRLHRARAELRKRLKGYGS